MKKIRTNYKISKKLGILMALEILLLTLASCIIIFFNRQNYILQQDNTFYHVNHSLLLQTNSILEKLDTALDFPLAHIADRYQDPLLKFLIEKEKSGISETDFYRIFANRTSEVSIQFPDLESVLLFDIEGNLLDSKTIHHYLIPLINYSNGTWYQKCVSNTGKMYILNDEETSYLNVRKTDKTICATRILYDYLTFHPFCITLASIRATDIPVTFETAKKYPEQQYAIFDSSNQKLIGTLMDYIPEEILKKSTLGDYKFKQSVENESYLYHISYSSESNGIYSVVRTPYRILLTEQLRAVFGIFFAGFILISINISIFAAIIRSINQPLSKLIHTCEEIGNGNFNIRIPDSTTDELSYLTLSLNSMTEKIKQLINEVYIKNLTKRDLELQMLRSQINPHFLYNTLENMRMSAYTQGYFELSEMCLLLSKVLRYGVSEQSKLVNVREELAHLKDYTNLLSYCFPTIQIHVFADEKLMDYPIIKVILQPLVENSINHTSKSMRDSLQIQVWAFEKESELLFTVSDNGDGIEESYLKELIFALDDETDTQHGIGLKNIHRRIKLYYGEEYGLTIKSAPGRGTAVTVHIPTQNKQ